MLHKKETTHAGQLDMHGSMQPHSHMLRKGCLRLVKLAPNAAPASLRQPSSFTTHTDAYPTHTHMRAGKHASMAKAPPSSGQWACQTVHIRSDTIKHLTCTRAPFLQVTARHQTAAAPRRRACQRLHARAARTPAGGTQTQWEWRWPATGPLRRQRRHTCGKKTHVHDFEYAACGTALFACILHAVLLAP